MSRRISLTHRFPLLLAAGAVVAACSSAPGGEDVGSSNAAVTQTETGVFNAFSLAVALGGTNLFGSSLPYWNGQIEFIPSACGTPDLASFLSANTFALPQTTVSTGNLVCPTYTAYFTGLSSSAFAGTVPFGGAAPTSCTNPPIGNGTAVFTSSGLQLVVPVAGTIHLEAGTGGENLCPSGDINVTSGAITVNLAWLTASQEFHTSVSAGLQYNVSNCWGGLCDGVMASSIPNLDTLIGTNLTNQLNTAFSNTTTAAKVAGGLYQTLAVAWNATHEGDLGGGVAWSVVPGSVAYSSSSEEFTFQVERNAAIAPNCQYTANANGTIGVKCTPDATNDEVYVFSKSASGWTEVDDYQLDMIGGSNWMGGTNGQSYTFLGCSYNASASGSESAWAAKVAPGAPGCDATATTVNDPVAVCTPLTTSSCSSAPGQCGPIPNGCGGTLECPACPPCVPTTTCSSLKANCATTDDCGNPLDCGSCSTGDSCSNGLCCPTGEVGSAGICCPAGEAATNGHCCLAGDLWGGVACVAPPHVNPPPPPKCGKLGC